METTQSKDNRLDSLVIMYDMQTPFFTSAIDGITDKDAHNRMNTKANHIAWLAGSLVAQRYELANQLTNGNYKHSGEELFKDNQGIKDDATYPSLEQYKKDWETITPIVHDALLKADAETLNKKIEIPGMDISLFDLITFIIYREANHIGQIALWRRLHGYDPMKYM
jgi:hypothetical protein